MDVFRLLLAVLARAIGRDVGHRARPVERDERDDVLEAVGLHVEQRAPHALRFPPGTRRPSRRAPASRRSSRRRAGSPRDRARCRAASSSFTARLQHGQRLQAEEVELHQPRRLDPFHVELGDRHVGFRIAVERHELGERPVADHDAGGVRRGVAVEPFELQRDVEQRARPPDRASRSACSCGSPSIACASVTGVGRVLRHQLAELVDLPVGHLQHAADVAQHAARLQRAEGDDLRHLVAAVALLHVADHLVAAVLAEVDVEVRHRHALGIEEALEQQAEAQRIEIGDGERIGDQRAGARAAARPDRNALRLRPLDEVGDDQEVAGILHPLDDVELEVEPLAVVLVGAAGREPVRGDAARRGPPRPGARSSAASSTARLAVADREARQDRLARARPEGAALARSRP